MFFFCTVDTGYWIDTGWWWIHESVRSLTRDDWCCLSQWQACNQLQMLQWCCTIILQSARYQHLHQVQPHRLAAVCLPNRQSYSVCSKPPHADWLREELELHSFSTFKEQWRRKRRALRGFAPVFEAVNRCPDFQWCSIDYFSRPMCHCPAMTFCSRLSN